MATNYDYPDKPGTFKQLDLFMSKGKQVTISLSSEEGGELDHFYRIFGHGQPSKEMLAALVKECALDGAKLKKRKFYPELNLH